MVRMWLSQDGNWSFDLNVILAKLFCSLFWWSCVSFNSKRSHGSTFELNPSPVFVCCLILFRLAVSLYCRVQLWILPLWANLCKRMSTRLRLGLAAPQLHSWKLHISKFRPGLPALPTALPDLQQPQRPGLPVLPLSQLPGPRFWHLPAH